MCTLIVHTLEEEKVMPEMQFLPFLEEQNLVFDNESDAWSSDSDESSNDGSGFGDTGIEHMIEGILNTLNVFDFAMLDTIVLPDNDSDLEEAVGEDQMMEVSDDEEVVTDVGANETDEVLEEGLVIVRDGLCEGEHETDEGLAGENRCVRVDPWSGNMRQLYQKTFCGSEQPDEDF